MNFLTIEVDDDLMRHDANNKEVAKVYKLTPKSMKKLKQFRSGESVNILNKVDRAAFYKLKKDNNIEFMHDNLRDDFIQNFGIDMSPDKVNSIIYPKPEFTNKLSRKRKAKGKIQKINTKRKKTRKKNRTKNNKKKNNTRHKLL